MVRSVRRVSLVTTLRSSGRSIRSIRPTPMRRSCIQLDVQCGHLASRSLMRAETPFQLVGDLIGLDAVIVGPTGRAEVMLILDTAAVMTTVVPSVAESIGYSSD